MDDELVLQRRPHVHADVLFAVGQRGEGRHQAPRRSDRDRQLAAVAPPEARGASARVRFHRLLDVLQVVHLQPGRAGRKLESRKLGGKIARHALAARGIGVVALARFGGERAARLHADVELGRAVGRQCGVDSPLAARSVGSRIRQMGELAFARLVDDERQRTAIEGRQLGRAGVFGGAVEIEVHRRDVGDGVIERREAGRVGLELAAHARAHEHHRCRYARFLQHGDDERRLVFAVAPSAREGERAGPRLVAVDAELERHVARALDDLAVNGAHLGRRIGEALGERCHPAPHLVVGDELIFGETGVPRREVVPRSVGRHVDVTEHLAERRHGGLGRERCHLRQRGRYRRACPPRSIRRA